MRGGQNRPKAVSQKSEVRSELVRFRETDTAQGSSRREQEFLGRHSGREDARDPTRSGARRGESVIVSCQN
jgi:hypothetical protein